jgi:hypothetical protein
MKNLEEVEPDMSQMDAKGLAFLPSFCSVLCSHWQIISKLCFRHCLHPWIPPVFR